MNSPEPSGLRATPDLSITSATRAPVAPELRAADRQAGGLIVRWWTYRFLRFIINFFGPKPELSGVEITSDMAGQRLRVVRPETVTGTGALLLFHGGGFVIGSSEGVLAKAIMLARGCGIPVIFPDYRQGPQHPFPAALDDAHAAWHWLLEQAPTLGIDPGQIVIGGYSAGGGLAASLAQRLHDEGSTQPAAQLLIYPMLDDQTALRRELDTPRHRVWSNANNLFGWTSYLGHAPGLPSLPYAVPARRSSVAGLPPTWLGVGTPDLFLDEDRDYGDRLRRAGVEVCYVEVDGGIHGFDSLHNGSLTRAFEESMTEFVRRFTS